MYDGHTVMANDEEMSANRIRWKCLALFGHPRQSN